ncbi:hypothetical protein G3N95_29970 [Paraburkholderia sp. Tr-20389]|uniref:hypothetical protein n=1 Tax=Paraburkholderia sp. Tr-20389 TaxID=2703903 RepID=UPI00197EDD2F|nr:hypothetical protein [Paraburkholderia sp. Tr-20389]MBN3757202.1 hypothetical protein [Paraburkholderia sp. Tr-20389]
MTAIGFALMLTFGYLFGVCDGLPFGWQGRGRDVCALVTLIGFVLAIAGVAMWLWRVMP